MIQCVGSRMVACSEIEFFLLAVFLYQDNSYLFIGKLQD